MIENSKCTIRETLYPCSYLNLTNIVTSIKDFTPIHLFTFFGIEKDSRNIRIICKSIIPNSVYCSGDIYCSTKSMAIKTMFANVSNRICPRNTIENIHS